MLVKRRLAIVATIVAALATVVAFAAPAQAAEVKVQLRNLGSTVTAGGRDLSFQAVFSNPTNERVSEVYATIAVQLGGASPDQIRVRRGNTNLPKTSGSDGTVVFEDGPFNVPRSGRTEGRNYALSFAQDVPPGQASITVVASVLVTENGEQRRETLGSASGTVTVLGPGGETMPPNTDPGIVPTVGPVTTYSLAPLPVAQEIVRPQASVPPALYVLGVALIALGVATLLRSFRPPGRVATRVAGAAPHRIGGPAPSWHRRGGDGGSAAQAWPTVAREPVRRPQEPGPRQEPPPRRPLRDPGPQTGTMRPVRDPAPGRPSHDQGDLPPWARP